MKQHEEKQTPTANHEISAATEDAMEMTDLKALFDDLEARDSLASANAVPGPKPLGPQSGIVGYVGAAADEVHYTPQELAKLWGLSATKIRRMFENEPGVLRVGEPSRRQGRGLKRSYYTMRIPVSVAERVYKRNES